MEFDDAKRAFVFRVIRFPESSRREKAEFSGDNPRQCLSCHRQDPRPNWESYPTWPGTFDQDEETSKSGFRRFVEKSGSYGRYRFLVNVDEKYRGFNYAPDDDDRDYTLVKPNTLFTVKLFKLNFARLARKLEAHPEFSRYRRALVAAARGCVFSGEEEELARFDKIAASGYRDEQEFSAKSAETLAALSFVTKRMGISMSDWSLSFTHPYSFEGGLGNSYDSDLGAGLVSELGRDFSVDELFHCEKLLNASAY
jgi:hypothetical protein